jgi:signal transduction histidine kinase
MTLVRCLTVAKRAATPLAPGLAVQVASPLNTVGAEVASVGATLALLSAVGVALAALAAQRQLVSYASHELRAPLTSLRINVELLATIPACPGQNARRCWTGSSPRSRNSASAATGAVPEQEYSSRR